MLHDSALYEITTDIEVHCVCLYVCACVCQVLWTGRPCRNFHLLLCIAVLITEKTVLIQNNFGFTEILKVCLSVRLCMYV